VLYPEGHPYAHPVIGSAEDIRSATLQDVIDFFNTYYVPSNATLVLGGDFDPAVARTLIEKYFSVIPKRPKPQRPEIPAVVQPAKARHTVYDDVQVPMLTMHWHSPAFFAPGDAELDILATLLCNDKNSRLINRLVYEKQIASNVSCGQLSGLASTFLIEALPMPGVPLETLEEEILDEIRAIARDGITEKEFARTKNGIETSYVKQMQSIGSRADNFNSYYFYTGKTDFPHGDLERYRKATTATLMEVVRTMFTDDARRSTIIVLPKTGDKP